MATIVALWRQPFDKLRAKPFEFPQDKRAIGFEPTTSSLGSGLMNRLAFVTKSTYGLATHSVANLVQTGHWLARRDPLPGSQRQIGGEWLP